MFGAAGAPVTIAPATPLGTMSAQAVLSMIASALPATPRGSSTGDDASGFQGLLAALVPADGEVANTANSAGAPDDRTASPSAHPFLLGAPVVPVRPAPVPPVADDASTPDLNADPQILPGTPPVKDVQPQVLPDIELSRDPEPQVLPATPTGKEVEAQVLPGAPVARQPEPQVLPDTTQVKNGPEPQVQPNGLAGKEPGPQVLPGAVAGKEPQPQVLPGSANIDVPAARGGDTMEVASSGPSPDSARPTGTPTPAPSLQPTPPLLRALAERTSRPLDDAGAAPSSSPPDPKGIGSIASPASPQTDQPGKSSLQPAPAPTALQGDAAERTPEEPTPGDGRVTSQAEAAAPARDHSLPTLSRATIDATAQIAAQILRKLEGRSTRFEIALRPDELGRVDVKLDIDAEGRLAARLAFDNPAAATDLRGRADELRRQLEAAGFQLADDAFEFADRDSGSSAFDRGQDAREGQNRAFAAAARLKTEIDMAQPPQWLALSLSPSGVDMKV